MKEELKRRLNILNEIRVTPLTQMQLRGGMQDRLRRQEILRYGERVKKQKKKLKDKLSLIQQEKQSDEFEFSTPSIESLDNFNEPIFRRIRSRRGFFNE